MATRDRTKRAKDLKVTPEQHERLKRIGTQKGQPSRNPNGRPVLAAELKLSAAEMSPASLKTLEWLRDNSKNDMVRLKAAETILSFNMSKAAQEQKMTLDVGPGISDLLARAGSRANVIEGQVEAVRVIQHEDGNS
ncbi:hypothetical protein KX729_09215 [Rhizobium sp. XQZ8]|uniref:hypothetical protein n=1 Tax=Rhizobium populisoli TaxID=2859785 RepID=UPI001CA4E6FE|nr:hypothetical protein [Rhizobium populisoli]MBW6421618.1 hypothetical protein [Rhizobium populisoli]